MTPGTRIGPYEVVSLARRQPPGGWAGCSSIPEAVSRGIFLDINARVQIQATALGGTVSGLGPQDVAPQSPTGAGGYPRSWPFWKQRAMGNQ